MPPRKRCRDSLAILALGSLVVATTAGWTPAAAQDAAAGVLEGKIVLEPDDAAPGVPVDVTFFPEADGRGRQTRSAPDGTFRLEKLPVPVRGCLRLYSVEARIDATPEVRAGTNGKPLLFRVKPSAILVVTVQRSPGKPWIEPEVAAEWARTNSTYSVSHKGLFPRGGRYELMLDDPSEPIVVRFRAFGLPSVETRAEKTGPGQFRADMKTPAAGTLACIVRDAAEKPVSGAEVVITFVIGPGSSMEWREGLLRDWFTDEAGASHLLHYDYMRGSGSDLYEIATTTWTTGADGRARVEAVPAGAACEIATAPAGLGAATSSYGAPRDRREDREVPLAVEPAGGGIALRILKADGRPAAGWAAIFQWGPLACHGPRSFPRATADADGRVRASFLEGGSTYDVILVAPEGAKVILKGVTVKDGGEIFLPGAKPTAPSEK